VASLPRKCPECRASLEDSRPQRNGKVRCPECGTIVGSARDDDDSDDGIRTERGSSRPAAKGSRSARRYHDDDDDRPVRKDKGLSLAGPIVIGVGVGLVGLLLICGGIGAYWFLAPSNPAADAPVALGAEQPVNAAFAPPPLEQGVAQPPAVAPPALPAGPPPLALPAPPEPDQPVGPVQEPIRPAQPGPGGAPAAGALPLEELKAASVYIKAMTANMGATGSGFVVRAQGGTAYVVTNHHVVTPPRDNGMGLPFGPGFGPRGPRFPRPGFGLGGGVLELTAVFRSGMDGEQSAKAVLVGDDKDADLAVLKVTGLKNTPRPINYEQTPQLKELMPVVAFGFPFGEDLDPKKKNPAITVTKGEISSLRADAGQLARVQLNLNLNPGNSGGPVVDDKGNLVGIAVAKIDKTDIGFAIPVHKLARLLDGQIDPPSLMRAVTANGHTQVFIEAKGADPLGRLRAPTLLYGLADQVKVPGRRGEAWDGIGGAKTSPIKFLGARAIAEIAVALPQQGELRVIAQVATLDNAGKTIYGEPKILKMAFGAAPGGLGVGQLPPGPGPAVPGQDFDPFAPEPAKPAVVKDVAQLLADLKSPDEATRQKAANALRFSPPHERLDEVKRGLRDLLASPDAATRSAGALALATCDPKEAAPVLAKLLEDESPAVRHAVLSVMKDLKDPRVAEAVAARLPTDSVPAGEALKAMGPAAEKAVIPYLGEKYAGPTRFWTFFVIKEIGGAASIPALEAVQGPDTIHVVGVLQAVRGRVPLTKDEWPKALADLKVADVAVRSSATRRIWVTPPLAERRAEVVAKLESLLNDQSGDVRAAAFKGLVRWAGKDAVPILAPRLEGFDPFGKVPVFDALAELKEESAAAVVAKRLADVHDRGNALRTLKAMGPVAEKSVLALLQSPDVFVVLEASKVLAEIGGRDSLAPLETAVKTQNVFYSEEAAKALALVKARVEAGQKK